MKSRLALIIAPLLLASGQAMAIPVTIGFSGTLGSLYPGSTANGPYNGKAFSGTMSFDLAGHVPVYQNYVGSSRYDVWSDVGCSRFRDGICETGPLFSATPLISHATISGEFGSFSLYADNTGGATHSNLTRSQNAYSGYTDAGYSVLNDTGYFQTTADGLRLERVVSAAGIFVSTRNAPLFSDFHDLAELPAFSKTIESTFRFQQFTSVRDCVYGDRQICTDSYLPGQFDFYGQIAEIHLMAAESPIDVPEPASLAIVGFGLVSIGAARRRKSTRIC